MAVICSGLPVLLNICASGILPNSSLIHYVIFENTYDPHSFRSYDPTIKTFAQDIVDSLGYKILFYGPFKYSCPPAEARQKGERVIITEQPQGIPIDKNNIISQNIINFFNPQLKGVNVEIFPEGASCFSQFGMTKSHCINIWNKNCKPFLRYIHASIFKPYEQSRKTLLLPDMDGRVSQFVSGMPEYFVLPSSLMWENYKKAAKYFCLKYPDFDFSELDTPFFHPLLDELDEQTTQEWMKKFVDIIGTSPLLVKKRPRDVRHIDFFGKAGSKINIVLVPDRYTRLPAELILCQKKMKYIGYYTTLLLSVSRSDVFLIEPPDSSLAARKAKTFSGLRAVLSC